MGEECAWRPNATHATDVCVRDVCGGWLRTKGGGSDGGDGSDGDGDGDGDGDVLCGSEWRVRGVVGMWRWAGTCMRIDTTLHAFRQKVSCIASIRACGLVWVWCRPQTDAHGVHAPRARPPHLNPRPCPCPCRAPSCRVMGGGGRRMRSLLSGRMVYMMDSRTPALAHTCPRRTHARTPTHPHTRTHARMRVHSSFSPRRCA